MYLFINKYRKVWTWSMKALKPGPGQKIGTESQTGGHTDTQTDIHRTRYRLAPQVKRNQPDEG